MNLRFNTYITKRRLFFYFLLKDRLCDDLIEKIIKLTEPNININHLDELKTNYNIFQRRMENKSVNIGDSYHNWSSILWNRIRINKIIENDRLLSNIDLKLPLEFYFLIEHSKHCNCELCSSRFDYPRYKYLSKLIKNRKRGFDSRRINQWILLQYYILNTRGIGIYNCYGFTSIYDRLNNYKRKEECKSSIFYEGYINHIVLRDNKQQWIYLEQIWNRNQLLI